MQSVRDVHIGGVSEAVSLTYHRRQQLFPGDCSGPVQGHAPRTRSNLARDISSSLSDLVVFGLTLVVIASV